MAEAVGCDAWAVFREIVDRDCQEHPLMPGEIRCGLAELGKATGLAPEKVGKAIKKLVRGKYIRAFVPDNFFEECIIQVSSPLDTPVPAEKIQAAQQIGLATEWRYTRALGDHLGRDQKDQRDPKDAKGEADPISQKASPEISEQWLLDRIMGVSAGAVNAFTLDRIRWMAAKWGIEDIKVAWENVRKWRKPSLYAMERELTRGKGTEGTKGTKRDIKKSPRREWRRRNYR
jgi:DNA-binding Lrp family transcriptional regulator